MTSWLASHALEVIFGVIVALSGGWVGLQRRRDRQLKSCRAKNRKLAGELGRARRNYAQSLEFNQRDRWMIIELAKMVSGYREQLDISQGDIILELHAKAEAELRARRLPAAGIHLTSSTEHEEEEDIDE